MFKINKNKLVESRHFRIGEIVDWDGDQWTVEEINYDDETLTLENFDGDNQVTVDMDEVDDGYDESVKSKKESFIRNYRNSEGNHAQLDCNEDGTDCDVTVFASDSDKVIDDKHFDTLNDAETYLRDKGFLRESVKSKKEALFNTGDHVEYDGQKWIVWEYDDKLDTLHLVDPYQDGHTRAISGKFSLDNGQLKITHKHESSKKESAIYQPSINDVVIGDILVVEDKVYATDQSMNSRYLEPKQKLRVVDIDDANRITFLDAKDNSYVVDSSFLKNVSVDYV